MAYPSKAKWIVPPAASVALRYGLALVSVTVAQGVAHTFLYFHLPQPLTAFALCAIAITFRYGGTEPGLLAALLAALIRGYVFEPEVNTAARLCYDFVFLIFAMLMIHFTRERKELELRVAERTAELTRANEDLKLEIAERKQAEEAVKKVEGRLRLVLDTTPALIHSARPDGYLDYFNQRWLNYVGLSLEDLQGWGWTTVIHPEDLEGIAEKWRTSLINGKDFVHEARMRRADGEYRWQFLCKVPLRDMHGNIVKWYGSAIGIEDRKRVEEALRTSDQEQRRIAEQLERERARLVEAQEVANIGSWELESESLNVIWSEQTHRIFETDPSRFLPTRPKFLEFIHPEDRTKVDAAFKASLDNPSPCTVEYRIIMLDGRVKFLEERWQTFHDKRGKPVRVAGTCRDITERVRAEEELRQLSGRLLRLQDEERRRIARDLHDSMGQDLVALATMLGQLHGAIPSSERKARRILSECKALADRCIREIRTLSYLLHPPALDQAGLGDAIRDYVTGFTRRSGIRVELELPPGLGRMTRDVELALFRVVQEALTNIQRHSGSQRAKIRIDHNSHLTMEISDLGHGASARQQRGKEEPRFEVGVGIPSMQERVKLIGGRFEFESTSQGTTVRVTISLERNEREKAAHSGG
jgi:PAS domain S-box-containing protein